MLLAQAPALAVYIWWSGRPLARVAEAAHDGVATVVLICVSTPFQIVMLALLAWRIGAKATDYLGLKPPTGREIALGVIAVAVLLVAGEGLDWLIGEQGVTPFQTDIYRTAMSAGWLLWLWLTVVVAAPAGEEILFRGFLFRGWLPASGDGWLAVAATSALWAALHVQYDLFTMGNVLALGLLLGWMRWRTGSSILTMILHALVNAEGMFETFLQLRA
jgi:hypothetical protein